MVRCIEKERSFFPAPTFQFWFLSPFSRVPLHTKITSEQFVHPQKKHFPYDLLPPLPR